MVPICYALIADTVYLTIDEKPKKRPGAELKRLANLRENPFAALVVDRYDDDWTRLAWVMLQGRADILPSAPSTTALRPRSAPRYPQIAAMRIAHLPVVAIRVDHAKRGKARAAGRSAAPAGTPETKLETPASLSNSAGWPS